MQRQIEFKNIEGDEIDHGERQYLRLRTEFFTVEAEDSFLKKEGKEI